jgi:acetyl esterase/lipase
MGANRCRQLAFFSALMLLACGGKPSATSADDAGRPPSAAAGENAGGQTQAPTSASGTGGTTGVGTPAAGGASAGASASGSANAGGGAPASTGAAAQGGSDAGKGGTAGVGGRMLSAAGAPSASGGGSPAGGAPSGGNGGATAGAGPLTPPMTDTSSTLGISAPGSGYTVEGNIPYGPLTMQRLDVMYPKTAGPKGTTTLPGVIMFHGGGWTDTKPSALKASMSSFFSRFLEHGFLVCNVEYRSADGSSTGAIAPAADEDALLAAKWFWDYMDYYHVDRTKYVTTGASAGGQLALMVGMATADSGLGPTNPNDFRIAAIVNGYGPADVTDLLAKNVSFAVQWLPADTPNRDAIAKAVSAVTYARQDIPPLITVQGDMDTTVPRNEAQELADLLTAAGADNALHWVAGAGHGFSTPSTAWPDAETAMFDFLVQHGIGK